MVRTPSMPASVPTTTEGVPASEDLCRDRRGDHVLATDDGDDRGTCQGAGSGVAQRGAVEPGTVRDVDRGRGQPGDLAGQIGEPFGDPRGSHDLRDRVRLLGGQDEQRGTNVGILGVIPDDLKPSVPVGDDTEPVPD